MFCISNFKGRGREGLREDETCKDRASSCLVSDKTLGARFNKNYNIIGALPVHLLRQVPWEGFPPARERYFKESSRFVSGAHFKTLLGVPG